MTQIYSDPSRESDPHALPDVEVFHVGPKEVQHSTAPTEEGWYWWACSPGCMPDSDPNGPFNTEDEAIADAQEPFNTDTNMVEDEGQEAERRNDRLAQKD